MSPSQQIREPAVAGTFYPSSPEELTRMVDGMLSDAATDSPATKAVIAPHAGYIYSGPIAASAYARVRNSAAEIDRVVLLGPSHRVGFQGIAATTADSYRTPLGEVPIDKAAVQRAVALPNAGYLDQAHGPEHSLEVHLPFLQRALGTFSLVPLVVGQAQPEDVSRVLEELWGGNETLIVISSDLSHHRPYAAANTMDRATCEQIESLRGGLTGEQACGCNPINGLLHLADRKGLEVTTIDYRNSGDTAGSRDAVVGYGAYLVSEPDAAGTVADTAGAELGLAARQGLLHLARHAILHHLDTGSAPVVNPALYPPELARPGAAFVTLNMNGALRGCIGSLVARRPLVEDVALNAIASAFQDSRFRPLTAREYPLVDVHISVLSEPAPFPVTSRSDLLARLRPGIDGLIIEEGGRRATFLPSVWEQLPDPDEFVAHLRAKAGLDPQGWQADTQVLRYVTEEFC